MSDEKKKTEQPNQAPESVEMTEDEVFEAVRRQNIMVIAAVTRAFAPAELTNETILHIAGKFFDQQEETAPIMTDATEPKTREEFPEWGVQIFNIQTGELVLTLRATKDVSQARDVNDALISVNILGLLVAPALRAILFTCGYGVKFAQFRGPPEAQIIVPGT